MKSAAITNPINKPAATDLDNKPALLSRIVVALYLLTLALLPWSWFPPFPWLHAHAQWSDAVFAVTAALWIIELWRARQWPRVRPTHAAMALYFILAALSLLTAAPGHKPDAWKLLGVAELCALAVITSDIAARARAQQSIARVIAATSLVMAAAAVAGLMLFYAGVSTRLMGIYGELTPSDWYARIQAGFYNPNLLASFCIFAASAVACDKAELPAWLRRLALAALYITVGLTFSRGILGFGLAAIIRMARTRRRRIFAAVAAGVCVCAMLLLTFYKLSLDPVNPANMRFDTSAPSSRRQAFTTSLATVAANPISGSGLGTSPGNYQGTEFDAHMTVVNIAATLGLPALITFASLFAMLWRRRSRTVNLAVWGGLAGLAVDGLAQDIEDFRHLWVMIGFADADSIEQPARPDQA